jgi:hypothetical protein
VFLFREDTYTALRDNDCKILELLITFSGFQNFAQIDVLELGAEKRSKFVGLVV